MRLLFVHDATFKRDNNGNHYGTSVNNNTLERYHYISNDVSIMIRSVPFKDNESVNNYTRISDEYKVIPIPNLMTVKGLTIEYANTKKWLRSELPKYDCVIARLSGLVGELAASICCELHIPYIVECVGNPWDSLWYYGLSGKCIAPFIYKKTRSIIKNASHVIYVTNKYLQSVFPTNGQSVGCSNVTLPESDDRLFFKRIEKIKNKNKRIIIGSAGKVDMKYKGYQYVIKAIPMLKMAGIDVVYEVVGGGDQTYLKNVSKNNNVTENVVFRGVMSHEQVLNWMDTIDIYIQPSNTEGLPRSLIEAMSRGCPCVGSNAGGIPELLDENCIFPKKKVNDLFQRLLYVYYNMETCASRNFEASKDYEYEKIVARRNLFFDLFINSFMNKYKR